MLRAMAGAGRQQQTSLQSPAPAAPPHPGAVAVPTEAQEQGLVWQRPVVTGSPVGRGLGEWSPQHCRWGWLRPPLMST